MDIQECLQACLSQYPKAEQLYYAHMEQNGVFLSHIFFEDALVSPLFLAYEKGREEDFISLALFIENMWLKGNGDLQNVVDVTLLERISEDTALWQRFGQCLSETFKNYINTELLPSNIMMQDVPRLL